MRRDVGGVAAISRAQPDIVGAHEAALQRKMDAESLAIDAGSYLFQRLDELLGRQVVLHLLKAHEARRGEDLVAVVRFIQGSDDPRGDGTTSVREPGISAAGL